MIHRPTCLVATLAVALVALLATRTAAASTTITGGNVINQTWTAAGSPYYVQGDVTVPAGAFLTLQAGTVVQMSSTDGQGSGVDPSRVELTIHGTLNVEGVSGTPVTLEPQSGSAASTWYGVIVSSDATAAGIAYANVSGAVIGIWNQAAGSVTQVSRTNVSSSSTGIQVAAGSPTLDAVTLQGNSFGLAIEGSAAPTITGSLFLSNSSYGVYSDVTAAATTTLRQCTFYGNYYGILVDSGTSASATLDVVDTIVTGGTFGVYRSSNGVVNVTYSDVWGNSSANFDNVAQGTGVFASNPIYVDAPSNVRITSNSPARFAGDTGGDIGALPYASDATPGLYGTLWTNTWLSAASSPYAAAGDLTVAKGVTLTIDAGVTVQFATTDIMGSGVDVSRAELIVDGALIVSGEKTSHVTLGATTAAASAWYGVTLEAGSTGTSLTYLDVSDAVIALDYESTGTSAISYSTFTGSSTGVQVTAGAPAFDALFVTGNSFGFALESGSATTITNSVIASNSSYGVYADLTSATTTTVMNCTLDANYYGILVDSGTSASAIVDVQNSIITNGTFGVYRSSNGIVTVTYSDVWGNSSANYDNVAEGTGGISQNPNFVNPPSQLSLQASSVCVDSGDGTGAPDHDILGVHRPVNGTGLSGAARWDMGAYELVPTPACGDGVLQSPEQCDDGAANGTSGDCCSASCEFQPTTVECRAATLECTAAAYCNGQGSCPANAPLSGTSCSGGTCSAGECVPSGSSSSSSSGGSSSSSSSSSGGSSSSSSSSSGGSSGSSSSSSGGSSGSASSSSGGSSGSASSSSGGSSGGASSSSGGSGGSSSGSSTGSSSGSAGEDDGGTEPSNGAVSTSSGCSITAAGRGNGAISGMPLGAVALLLLRRRRARVRSAGSRR